MIAAHIELILLLTGLATAGALVLFLAPCSMLKLLFGRAPADALDLLLARHWGLLVGLVGALLILACSPHPSVVVRRPWSWHWPTPEWPQCTFFI